MTGFHAKVDSPAAAADGEVNVKVNVASVLDLRVEKSGSVITDLNLSLTPMPGGTFVKDDLDVVVSTSNETGYVLTMADKDTNTTLTMIDPATNTPTTTPTAATTMPSITTLPTETTNTTTENNFPVNSWGYSLGSISDPAQTFSRIPSSLAADLIKTASNPIADDTTPVTFAAKADNTLTAGTYLDTIVFSATANYVPPITAAFMVSPDNTDQISGGETITIKTDIEWIDNIGQIVASFYPENNPSALATCSNPIATKHTATAADPDLPNVTAGKEYLRVTCTSPAGAAGMYKVQLELLRFNQTYTSTNSIEYINPASGVVVTAGTGIASVAGAGSYQYTDTVTLTATLSNGYNTPAWSVTQDASNTVASGLSATTGLSTSFIMPNNSVTIAVAATANTYTVAYDANTGSDAPSNTSLTYNAANNTLAAGTPTKTGHTFLGWSTDSAATTANYTAGQVLTATEANNLASGKNNGDTITLYAVWSINSYTISATKGAGISAINGTTGAFNYDATTTLSAVLSTGYNSPAWSITGSSTLSTNSGTSTIVTVKSDSVVTATATPNNYTIIYDKNSGTGTMANTTITYDATNNKLRANSFTKTGYTFLGWSTSSTATTATYSDQQTLTAAQTSTLAGTKANGANITLYAVWKANTYNIKYNSNQAGQTTYNTAQAVSGSMANTTATYDAAHTLSANGFSRAGFRFLGWSTNAAALTATYTNSQALTDAQVNSLVGSNTSGATINLYAIWQPQNQLTTITNMQQMTSAVCNATYTPKNTATSTNTNANFSADNVPQRTLSDTRDSKTYVVRKLADGNCWMVQNLRLVGSRTLTPSDSDVTSNFVLPASSDNFGTTNDAAGINIPRLKDSGNASYGVYY
ncbi:InlB B-repeat-containing protein, partial [Candidatus Saccharibacteria bacterium]|nr:InlB B-repeat-containing protein [Candidatus Saccharibacteria bacterium]